MFKVTNKAFQRTDKLLVQLNYDRELLLSIIQEENPQVAKFIIDLSKKAGLQFSEVCDMGVLVYLFLRYQYEIDHGASEPDGVMIVEFRQFIDRVSSADPELQ